MFYAPCLIPRIRNPSTDCEQAEGERHERGIRAPGQPLTQVSQGILHVEIKNSLEQVECRLCMGNSWTKPTFIHNKYMVFGQIS